MRKTDQEVQRLMREYAKHGEVGRAARAAAMDRKTASKYIKAGKLPSELRGERTWRTRQDPFEPDWPRICSSSTGIRPATSRSFRIRCWLWRADSASSVARADRIPPIGGSEVSKWKPYRSKVCKA